MGSLTVALLAAALLAATTLAAAFVTLAAALLTAALFTTTTLIAFTIVWHIPPLFDLKSIVFVSRLHSFKTSLQPALITSKENATSYYACC